MKKRMEVSIPRSHPAMWVACGFMAVSAVLRLWYYLPKQLDSLVFWVHLVMPVTAAAIFLLGLILGNSWAKGAGICAVVLGVAFFVIKAASFTPLHQALCTVLYLAVLVLFTATMLGILPTKKLLYPLFGLPLVYHLLVEDTKAYFFADPPVPVTEWMPELSVLCIMAALLCLSICLKTEKC